MQKLQKETKGNAGDSAQGSIRSTGEKSMGKASSQMMAIAARRLLSDGPLARRLASCMCRVGDEKYSAMDALEQKAAGATAGDAAKLSLYDAATILLGDTMLKIALHGYIDPSLSKGKHYSAAEAIADYILLNPNNWPVAEGSPACAQPRAEADPGPGASGWRHSVGHL